MDGRMARRQNKLEKTNATETQVKRLSAKWRGFPILTVAKGVRMGHAYPSPFPKFQKGLFTELTNCIKFHETVSLFIVS